MRLLLIRHGQIRSNVEGLLDTAVPGPELTDEGFAQADALVEALAGEDIEAVYASTLTRARLTAAPLAAARGLPVHVRDGVRELSAGDYEMRGDREAIRAYVTTGFAWAAGRIGLRMPGGENGDEALARYDAVIAEVAASGVGTAVVVSHGAAIRVWTAARAENVDVEFSLAHPLRNTGMIVLEGDAGQGWKVVSWTDAVIEGATGASGPASGEGSVRR